jgi:hypothetical protein
MGKPRNRPDRVYYPTLLRDTGMRAMADHQDVAGLVLHVAALRERAAEARRLAAEISDKLAQEGLLKHADEFDRHAEALEARIAAAKETDLAADPAPDIAALKPPSE